jgi:hypothetical protein
MLAQLLIEVIAEHVKAELLEAIGGIERGSAPAARGDDTRSGIGVCRLVFLSP